jgi:hypothetical protein
MATRERLTQHPYFSQSWVTEQLPGDVRRWKQIYLQQSKIAVTTATETIEPDNRTDVRPRITRDVTHTTAYTKLVETSQFGGVVAGDPYNTDFPRDNSGSACVCDNVGAFALDNDAFGTESTGYPDVALQLQCARHIAFKNSIPHITAGLSLPNFLYELKDLKKLLSVFDIRHSVRRNAESGILAYNFGVVPLISDIKGIYASVARIGAFWDHVRRNKGNLVTNTAIAPFKATISDDTYSDWSSTDSTHMNLHCRYKTSMAVKGHVKVQSVYKYDILDTSTGARDTTIPKSLIAKSVLQAFGICLDPSIVWEAIPFSFVLDWFLPVQDALKSMARDSFVPGYIIDRCDIHTVTDSSCQTRGQVKSLSSPESVAAPYFIQYGNRVYDRKANISEADVPGLTTKQMLKMRTPTGKQWFLGVVLGSSLLR